MDTVCRAMDAYRRDVALKSRILQRSPRLAYSLDEQQLGEASGRELAAKELRELGIEIGDSDDPIKIADAYHLGRAHAARDFDIPGNKLVGGNTVPGGGAPLLGSSSHDAADGGFVGRYLQGR